jgi:hypothetical protein
MAITTTFFEMPRFRDAVTLTILDSSCVLRHRAEEFEIDIEPETRADSLRLLDLLSKGGMTLPQLAACLPTLSAEVTELCRDLDRFGLLTETIRKEQEVKTGAQFYREMRRLADRARKRYGGAFYSGLLDGTITRAQLIGYALEYYHVVRMCPGLLAPALAQHDTKKTTRILQEFFTSELYHDKLLSKALSTVGVDEYMLDHLAPLPMTFSVCVSLGTYARQHPLSFKAALFLFEESQDGFHQAFRQRCIETGLPEGFYKPLLHHANINDDGDHEDISKMLYAEVTHVTPEEVRTVSKHLAVLIESMAIMDRQIVRYYGDTTNPSPRVVD